MVVIYCSYTIHLFFSLFSLKKFQYCFQHFLTQIEPAVFLNLAMLKSCIFLSKITSI